MSEDKKHLYVSIRGKDAICVLSLEEGRPKLIQTISCAGKHPRDFILIDDTLLCANRFTNQVVSFRIDKDGGLEEVIDRIDIPEVVSLLEKE